MRDWLIVLGWSVMGVGCTVVGEPALVYEPDPNSEPDADTQVPSDTDGADTSGTLDTAEPDGHADTGPEPDIEPPEPSLNYAQTILPVVRQGSCLGCHAGSRPQAGLNLSTLQGVLAGSQFGPVVKPCHPEESPLVQVLLGEDCEMPPTGSCLSQAHIELIRRWVAQGEDLQPHCE